MKNKLLVLAVLGTFAGAASAQLTVPPDGFLNFFTTTDGKQIFTYPGSAGVPNNTFIRTAPLASNGWAVTAGAGTDLTLTKTATAVLADARPVAMTVGRTLTAAKVFTALKGLTGPLGISLLLLEAMPLFQTWIDGDAAVNIRLNPTSKALEKMGYGCGAPTPPLSSSYSGAGWTYTLVTFYGPISTPRSLGAGWCSKEWAYYNPNYAWANPYYSPNGTPSPSLPQGWLPASMDDIAPYMTNRTPPLAFPDQLIQAGGAPEDSAKSIANGTIPQLPNATFTTVYPTPADKTSTSSQLGNPWGLAANTPTGTGTTSGTASIAPGATSSTGAVPQGYTPPAVGPVNTPTTTTSTSTYNPTTNMTTTTTVTHQDGATQTSTVSTSTTAVNTNNNTSTVTNNTSTVTNVTNNVTGATISTTTGTSTPSEPQTAQKTDCDKHPSAIGCSEYGTPPVADVLPKTSTPVSIVATTFATSSSCPADVTFTAYGSHIFGYASLCNWLASVRTLLLAIAAVIAAYVLITAFKV